MVVYIILGRGEAAGKKGTLGDTAVRRETGRKSADEVPLFASPAVHEMLRFCFCCCFFFFVAHFVFFFFFSFSLFTAPPPPSHVGRACVASTKVARVPPRPSPSLSLATLTPICSLRVATCVSNISCSAHCFASCTLYFVSSTGTTCEEPLIDYLLLFRFTSRSFPPRLYVV